MPRRTACISPRWVRAEWPPWSNRHCPPCCINSIPAWRSGRGKIKVPATGCESPRPARSALFHFEVSRVHSTVIHNLVKSHVVLEKGGASGLQLLSILRSEEH